MNSPPPKLRFITPPCVASTPKEIQERIEKLRTEITDTVGHMGASGLTTPLLLAKQADIMYLISKLSEISSAELVKQTDRLVHETVVLGKFTKSIRAFTIALFVFAVIQVIIMVFEYCSKVH